MPPNSRRSSKLPVRRSRSSNSPLHSSPGADLRMTRGPLRTIRRRCGVLSGAERLHKTHWPSGCGFLPGGRMIPMPHFLLQRGVRDRFLVSSEEDFRLRKQVFRRFQNNFRKKNQIFFNFHPRVPPTGSAGWICGERETGLPGSRRGSFSGQGKASDAIRRRHPEPQEQRWRTERISVSCVMCWRFPT